MEFGRWYYHRATRPVAELVKIEHFKYSPFHYPVRYCTVVMPYFLRLHLDNEVPLTVSPGNYPYLIQHIEIQ